MRFESQDLSITHPTHSKSKTSIIPVISCTLLSTILLTGLFCAILLFQDAVLRPHSTLPLSYSTPHGFHRAHAQISTKRQFPMPFDDETVHDSTATPLAPALLTAVNTRSLNTVASVLVPDLINQLQSKPIAPIIDENSKYLLTLPLLNLTSFSLLTENNLQVHIDGLYAEIDLFMQYKGWFLKYAVDIDTTIKNLTIHTTLDLINAKGILGLNVTDITVTADDISVKVTNNHFAWFMNWIKDTAVGDIKGTILKSIHDGLFKTLRELGDTIMEGVPPIAPMGSFNGALDLSLVGDIQYHSTPALGDGLEGSDHNSPSVSPHFPASPRDLHAATQTIVLGFNGETIDVKTRKPLSSGVQRHNITYSDLTKLILDVRSDEDDTDPFISNFTPNTTKFGADTLFTLILDEFVFNSYYDAWYNRGMRSSGHRSLLHEIDETNTQDEGNQQNREQLDQNDLFIRSFTIPLSSTTSIPALTCEGDNTTADLDLQQLIDQANLEQKQFNSLNQQQSSHNFYQSTIPTTQPHTNFRKVPNTIFAPLLAFLQQNESFATLNSDLLKSLHTRNAIHTNDPDLHDGPNTNIICEVSLTQRPSLDIRDGTIVVTTHSDQRYVLHTPASPIPYQLLFTISTTTTTRLGVEVQFDPIISRYVLSLSVIGLSNAFKCTYSLIGPISLDLLNILLQSVTNTTLLPLMNQQLMGIEMPTPNSFRLVDPQVRLDKEHFIVIKAGLEYLPQMQLVGR